MKKIIGIVLILACFAGFVYVGYFVFSKRNIQSVKVVGDVQSLYLVGETEKPNFQDAKLEITYKNNQIAYIKLSEADITVTDFSTSIEATRSMKVNYKAHIIDVPYVVINKGYYFVDSVKKTEYGEVKIDETFLVKSTPQLFYISPNGEFKYYEKSGSDWLLYDGNYLNNYKFDIESDKLNIYLGTENPYYTLTAANLAGEIAVSIKHSEKEYTDETRTLRNIDKYVKSNAIVSSFEPSIKGDLYSKGYFEFKLNQKLADRKDDISLKLNYSSPLLLVREYSEGQYNDVELLQTVYVVVDDSMIRGDFSTANIVDSDKELKIYYANKEFKVKYRVIN